MALKIEALSEQAPAVTKGLIDYFDNRVLKHMGDTPSDAAMRIEGIEKIDASLHRYIQEETIDPYFDIDFDGMITELSNRNEDFAEGVRGRAQGYRVEHVSDGMSRSMFPEWMDGCIQYMSTRTCSMLDPRPALDIYGRDVVGCGIDKMKTEPFIPALEFKCEPEGKDLDLTGMTTPLEMKVYPRCSQRIGTAYMRSLRCGGGNVRAQIVREINDNIRPQFEKAFGKFALRVLLDLDCGANCDRRYPPNVNGCTLAPYHLDGGSGPWVNKFFQGEPVTRCDARTLQCTIERMFEQAKHPVTGDLIDCCQNGWTSLVLGTGCEHEDWAKWLESYQVRAGNCDGPGCNEVSVYNRNARTMWGPTIYHAWMSRWTKEIMMEIWGPGTTLGLTEAQVEQIQERTKVVGCIDDAFRITVELDFTKRTYGGENTWPSFNQNIDNFESWEWKLGMFVNPFAVQRVILVQGVHDGGDGNQLVCTA